MVGVDIVLIIYWSHLGFVPPTLGVLPSYDRSSECPKFILSQQFLVQLTINHIFITMVIGTLEAKLFSVISKIIDATN